MLTTELWTTELWMTALWTTARTKKATPVPPVTSECS